MQTKKGYINTINGLKEFEINREIELLVNGINNTTKLVSEKKIKQKFFSLQAIRAEILFAIAYMASSTQDTNKN